MYGFITLAGLVVSCCDPLARRRVLLFGVDRITDPRKCSDLRPLTLRELSNLKLF